MYPPPNPNQRPSYDARSRPYNQLRHPNTPLNPQSDTQFRPQESSQGGGSQPIVQTGISTVSYFQRANNNHAVRSVFVSIGGHYDSRTTDATIRGATHFPTSNDNIMPQRVECYKDAVNCRQEDNSFINVQGNFGGKVSDLVSGSSSGSAMQTEHDIPVQFVHQAQQISYTSDAHQAQQSYHPGPHLHAHLAQQISPSGTSQRSPPAHPFPTHSMVQTSGAGPLSSYAENGQMMVSTQGSQYRESQGRDAHTQRRRSSVDNHHGYPTRERTANMTFRPRRPLVVKEYNEADSDSDGPDTE